MVNRRQTLGGLLAGALMPGNSQAGMTGGAAVPRRLDLRSERDLLTAMMKLRASTDGALCIEWLKGVQYGVRDTVLTPFFTLNSVTLSAYRGTPDGNFTGRRLEVVYHGDLDTNRPIETFRNPFTGREVRVEATRSGPLPVLFTPAGLVLPERLGDRRVEAESRIGPAITSERSVWIRFDTRSRIFEPGATRPGFIYNETTTYQGERAVVEDAGTSRAACQVAYTSVLGFKPWMEMGTIAGHLTNNATGEKVASVEALPPDMAAWLRATHPDLATDPRAALDALPPGPRP